MSKVRTNHTYSTLPEIIKALSCNNYPELTWVGNNYSKADLINDLTSLREKAIIALNKSKKLLDKAEEMCDD